MTETVTNDRSPVAKPVFRSQPRKPATVSATALAQHLNCTRAYIGKLEAEGVIQRHGDGFPLDQSRVAYLRYLWRERRQSPRSEADAHHVKVKTGMLQQHLFEVDLQSVKRDVRWNADYDMKRKLVKLRNVDGVITADRALNSRSIRAPLTAD